MQYERRNIIHRGESPLQPFFSSLSSFLFFSPLSSLSPLLSARLARLAGGWVGFRGCSCGWFYIVAASRYNNEEHLHVDLGERGWRAQVQLRQHTRCADFVARLRYAAQSRPGVPRFIPPNNATRSSRSRNKNQTNEQIAES